LSGTDVFIPTKQENVKFVRIVPCKTNGNITVEIEYEQEYEYKTDGNTAAIDLGINNLATMVFTDRTPVLFNGKPLKSINQWM
jgi:transposase